ARDAARACVTCWFDRVEGNDFAGPGVGERCVGGDERIHARSDASVAEEAYSDWIVHYCDGSVARGAGARAESAPANDLRLEELFVLFPADARPEDALWRAGCVFSREREHRARERADFAGRHDFGVSAAA